MIGSFSEKLNQTASLVEKRMAELLPENANFSDSKLVLAMNYSAKTKGKRIRPFLTLVAANIFNSKKDQKLKE
jgi:geranylgeranyl pyrophosphate synthase